jgi:hypothetical protein
VRGGAGSFYDLGYGYVGNAFTTYPFSALKTVSLPAFPLPAPVAAAPEIGGRPSQMYVMDRNLRLPLTYQWNVAAEQSLGDSQTVTVSYVGSKGQDLLKMDRYSINLLEWPGQGVTQLRVTRNNGHSDYRALQVQYNRRLQRGLQSLVSYTFARSRDTASTDGLIAVIPVDRINPDMDYGYSDYDVRHTLTAAVTYQMQSMSGANVLRNVVADWGFDFLLRARSSLPVHVVAQVPFPPVNEQARPNVVPGQPFWIEDGNAPGGRRLNRQAFSTPPINTQGDLPRGVVRGFNAIQLDVAMRRELRITSRTRLQLRFEMFNVLNKPNFANPSGFLPGALFGLSQGSLAQSLGGLNSLYQIGGPRSSQIAMKLLF